MTLKRRRASAWQLLHLLVRILGVTALAAALVGGFMVGVLHMELEGYSIAIGAVAIIGLALLVEMRSAFELVSSRRGAFGFNALLQIALMFGLVIAGNVFAFKHYQRFDCTRDQAFTLPASIRTQLAKLHEDTEILILLNHVSFGQGDVYKPDNLDFAAEAKIVEKVKDLADQFSDFGPRFRVRVLDTKDKGFKKKLKEIAEKSPDLGDAIKKAPENSIFFHSAAAKNIQRLSFSDIYQLDKQGSIDSNNLVLQYQGTQPFAGKVFNIQEKRPHVATAIVHPVLGFQNKEMAIFTMAGSKKILDAYGFESTDIMLRKMDPDGDLTNDPTILSYDESRYEQIEDELAEYAESIPDLEKNLTKSTELYKFWSESSFETLNKEHVYIWLDDGRQGVFTCDAQLVALKKADRVVKSVDVDDDDKKSMSAVHKQNADVIKHVLDHQRSERESLLKEKATLRVENLAEKRRLSDIEAKAKAMLANVDLLIIPRITLLNAPLGPRGVISNRAHKLDTAQLEAIKSFIKEGKPVLFLLGPTNEPREAPGPDAGGADPLEVLLTEIGFKLPKQTILYNIELKEYNERKIGVAFGKKQREVEVPGLKFDDSTATIHFGKVKEEFSPHAIRTSLRLMNRTTGGADTSEVRVKHPRPVYFLRTSIDAEGAAGMVGALAQPDLGGPLFASAVWLKKAQSKPDESAVFLVTREESWNEDNPFIVNRKPPAYVPPKEDDPRKGTVEEPRRGPFPIGVAVETQAPPSWFEKDASKAPKVRVAVIGSGGAFVGPSLTPLKEKMFLDVVNWLMGRDDLLARDVEQWSYPRVKVSKVEFDLWSWGAVFGVPFLCLYLGAVVGLIRRMR